MALQSLPPGTGVNWLQRGLRMAVRKPEGIYGAVAMIVLAVFVQSAVQGLAGVVLGRGSAAYMLVLVAVMVAGVMVYPLLFGGVLRVVHAMRHDRPGVRALQVFETFAPGQSRNQIIVFGVFMALLWLLTLTAIMLTVGQGLWAWYQEVMQLSASVYQQGADAAPVTLPPLPDGAGLAVVLFLAAGVLFGGINAIGLGQVALARRPALEALQDGVRGTLQNLLPLVVLAGAGFVLALLVLAAVAVLLSLLAAFLVVIHMVPLVMLLVLPLEIGLVFVGYAVMFCTMYAIWEDVSGGSTPQADVAPTRIAA